MFANARRGAFLALPAAALVLASGTSAQSAVVPGWHVQPAINTGAGNGGILQGAASDAPADAWAVGLSASSNGSAITPLVVHWNGTAWSQITLPPSVVTALGAYPLVNAVSAGSPKNVWALGLGGTWLHYDGTMWTSGRLGHVITDSALALSKTNVWAFGGKRTSTGLHAYAAHFNGVKWTATSVPSSVLVSASSAVSGGDIWAVAGAALLPPGQGHCALLHWSGGAWHLVTLPKLLANSALSSIVARSDTNVWIGGAVKNSRNGSTEAVGHWNGHTWAVAVLPAVTSSRKFSVTGLSSDGHGGIWAVANCMSCSGIVPTRIWHDSHGAWKRVAMAAKSPFDIISLALVPGTTSVWGAGAIQVAGTPNAMIALDGNAPH